MNEAATILVVDDIEANRLTIRELLDSDNYRLIEASDGPTALKLASENPPDLVLLDVMMPGMDGFEVCRRLRADKQLAEVPVILMTGYSLSLTAERVEAVGICQLLLKPTTIRSLGAAVHAALHLQPSH
jgi:CheY-like chemotaxis protein